MIRRCAWCNATVQTPDDAEGDEVTHGICQACTESLLREVRSGETETKNGEPKIENREPE